MSTKLAAREVHAILRRHCDPAFAAQGFTRLEGATCAWTRRVGSEWVTAWVQLDEEGWSPAFGSRFVLDFQCDVDPAAGAGDPDRLRRAVELMDAPRREAVRALNDVVLRRLPGADTDPDLADLPPEERALFGDGYEPSTGPYAPEDDVWLHYHAAADVEAWGALLADALPGMVARHVELARPAD